jgi:hypothetical protein
MRRHSRLPSLIFFLNKSTLVVALLLRLVFSQISKKLLVDGDYTGFDEGVN